MHTGGHGYIENHELRVSSFCRACAAFMALICDYVCGDFKSSVSYIQGVFCRLSRAIPRM